MSLVYLLQSDNGSYPRPYGGPGQESRAGDVPTQSVTPGRGDLRV